jgi:thymidylate synthase (FAD)
MSVKLIAATQGAGELINKTSQEVISYVGRVSNPSNQSNFETAPKLLKYLMNHNHWSPFEHASVTLEITTTRAIAAQILRHRSFTFQEFSQRYAEAQEMILCEARRQDTKNRQNSVDDFILFEKEDFLEAQRKVWDLSYSLYKKAIERGVAKECARFLLPLNTKTTIYMTGNIRSWIHYIELRSANGTQLEHMDIANECKKYISEIVPDVAKAMNWS